MRCKLLLTFVKVLTATISEAIFALSPTPDEVPAGRGAPGFRSWGYDTFENGEPWRQDEPREEEEILEPAARRRKLLREGSDPTLPDVEDVGRSLVGAKRLEEMRHQGLSTDPDDWPATRTELASEPEVAKWNVSSFSLSAFQ
jgi:hypothetical protein